MAELEGELTKLERQHALSELVLRSGTMRIDELAGRFGVSAMTVHRDLDALEAQGLLRKSRGIATAVATSLFEASTPFRVAEHAPQKRALARAALELIEPGQAILMDDSTTGLYLAERLPERSPMTVITNFRGLIDPLAGQPGLSLLCLGGEYYPWCDAFMGKMAIDAVRNLRADVFFMSTSAVTDGSCFHQTQDTVQVKRAMFESAQRRVLYVDSSKFARRALYALARLEEFDVVIVDDGLDPAQVERLRQEGVELLVASVEATPRTNGHG